jgi:hypothetical protein
MGTRRSFFEAACAAIAGLFCGGAFRLAACSERDAVADVAPGAGSPDDSREAYDTEPTYTEAEFAGALDSHEEQEHYIYRDFFIVAYPLVEHSDPTVVLQSERDDLAAWIGLCPSLHCKAQCGSREKALRIIGGQIDDMFERAGREGFAMPPTDVESRTLPDATRVGPHVRWYWSDREME